MTQVRDLCSGDIVALPNTDRTATFIGTGPHPVHSLLMLVIWRLDNGETSFDALSPLQDVGYVITERTGWASRLADALGKVEAKPKGEKT